MKITPSMIEAGVGAMARIKKQHPVDSSVVATVFSAMYAALEREQKMLAGTYKEPPYQHQNWPSWRYGPDGGAKLFSKSEDVPEGWSETPTTGTAIAQVPVMVERHGFQEVKPKRKYTRRAKDDVAAPVR